MSCINDALIQKYVDGETNPEEVTLVENHISICKKCGLKIENQRKLAVSVKKAINLLAKDSIAIPEFTFPAKNIKRHSLTIRRFSYIIAAACILLFVILITKKKEFKNEDEILLEAGSAMYVDANRPASELPLVISIIDVKGNITEYLIK
jgi:predicted anti-sigma-YlaC factor YlaD